MKKFEAKELKQIFNVSLTAVYVALNQKRTNSIGKEKIKGVTYYKFIDPPSIIRSNINKRLSKEVLKCVNENMNHLTQSATAKKCGCSQSFVNKIKNSK